MCFLLDSTVGLKCGGYSAAAVSFWDGVGWSGGYWMMEERLDGGWSGGMYTYHLFLFFVAERMGCWMGLYVSLIRILIAPPTGRSPSLVHGSPTKGGCGCLLRSEPPSNQLLHWFI